MDLKKRKKKKNKIASVKTSWYDGCILNLLKIGGQTNVEKS